MCLCLRLKVCKQILLDMIEKEVFFQNRLIDLVGSVFTIGPGDLGSIPGRIIPKTFKIVPDTSLHNTQQYKVRIKGKVEQSWEMNNALPYTSVLHLLKREHSDRPLLGSPSLLTYVYKNWGWVKLPKVPSSGS